MNQIEQPRIDGRDLAKSIIRKESDLLDAQRRWDIELTTNTWQFEQHVRTVLIESLRTSKAYQTVQTLYEDKSLPHLMSELWKTSNFPEIRLPSSAEDVMGSLNLSKDYPLQGDWPNIPKDLIVCEKDSRGLYRVDMVRSIGVQLDTVTQSQYLEYEFPESRDGFTNIDGYLYMGRKSRSSISLVTDETQFPSHSLTISHMLESTLEKFQNVWLVLTMTQRGKTEEKIFRDDKSLEKLKEFLGRTIVQNRSQMSQD